VLVKELVKAGQLPALRDLHAHFAQELLLAFVGQSGRFWHARNL
jgi:hypothetical protein